MIKLSHHSLQILLDSLLFHLFQNLVLGSLAAALGFAQYESPWDTAPSTSAPLSLTGLSVSLGGKKVISEVLNYTYENFLHQVILAETIASSDIGLNVGLINQEFWENSRTYYIDLARSREVNKDTPRELTFKCTNNSLVPIDCLIFAVYLGNFPLMWSQALWSAEIKLIKLSLI